MGFFIIFHAIALTTIFTMTDSTVTANQLSFLDHAKKPEVFDWMVRIRRKIHEHPELYYSEEETSQLIGAELDLLGIHYIYPVTLTGVVGYIGTGKAPFVALRASMDAVPIKEMVEWEHKSKIPGKMRACGHDGDVAMLLGAAKMLKDREDEIKGTIVLVFQPAEEIAAGAEKIVKAGVVGGRAGAILAASGIFEATIHGKGGPGAMPNLAIDPMVAASSAILSLQQLVSREAEPGRSWVVTVGNFHGDGAFHVSPDSVRFGGSFRALSNFDNLVQRIEQVITKQAALQRCNATVNFHKDTDPFYLVTKNDAELHKFFVKVARDLLENDDNVLDDVEPYFGYYQEALPGYFYLLGLQGPGEKLAPLHSTYFTLNEDALPYGAAVHASLVTSYLQKHQQDGES